MADNRSNDNKISSKARVLEHYPNAVARKRELTTDPDRAWVIRDNKGDGPTLGEGSNANAAWNAAAKELPLPGLTEVAPGFTVSGMSESQASNLTARLASHHEPVNSLNVHPDADGTPEGLTPEQREQLDTEAIDDINGQADAIAANVERAVQSFDPVSAVGPKGRQNYGKAVYDATQAKWLTRFGKIKKPSKKHQMRKLKLFGITGYSHTTAKDRAAARKANTNARVARKHNTQRRRAG